MSVHGVSKLFGVEIVLENVSFRLDPKEKVALVGRNGSGKTTLLKMICGELEPDAGSIQLSRGAKVGYLSQESPVTHGRTVLQEAESGQQRLIELKERLVALESRLEVGATQEDLEEYALVHEHFLDAEGYSVESDVRTVLAKMGFMEDEFEKKTDSLSGGEKTRLAIARLLLEEPDLLVLDEPTNHLDLQATEWLENWITQYHGAVLIVSHDREFLVNTAQKTIELRDHSAEVFPGGFEKYTVLRKERDERLADLARKQQDQIDKLDEYVRRFINTQRTAQARGRLKQMQKLEKQRVVAPRRERGMSASIKSVKRSGDLVIETRDLSIGFSDETLVSGLDWTVQIGERWGVIGDNGAGKSTLIRTMLGLHPPVAGACRLGASLDIGYFAQDAQGLDLERSPLQFMCYECGMDSGPARDLLGRFLFEGEDVFRPIRTLSGGEKNKLALAKLCYESPNLLVLDEPTNHLDMASREALSEVLSEYNGTLVVVSHDRWLLGNVTDRILDVKRSGAHIFPGSYQEYRSRQTVQQPAVPKGAAEKNNAALSPREVSKAIEVARRLVSEREEAVTKLESSLTELEAQLSSPEQGEDVVALSVQHGELKGRLEAAVSDWESAASELEHLQSLQ